MAQACGVEGVRTANADELSASARRALDRQQSVVIAVPVNYADYRRLF
jgi:thiamine pyrophosphate-dependent acetolactate synthase large subunit-like protein